MKNYWFGFSVVSREKKVEMKWGAPKKKKAILDFAYENSFLLNGYILVNL